MRSDARLYPRISCRCFGATAGTPSFHDDRQDTGSPGWQRLLEAVARASAERADTFAPFVDMSDDEIRDVVTLPAGIAQLTSVRHLFLYGSNIVRIPPEIGAMASLEKFTPYTSYRLHWYPYEITRCARLRDSTVSTRALYGNHKVRAPFPGLQRPAPVAEARALDLFGYDAFACCSVCRRPMAGHLLHQGWVSRLVATDVLPLLVNACSAGCLTAAGQGR